MTEKLKISEMIFKQNGFSITVLKWKDRRDVIMIVTKHSMNKVQIKRGKKLKPIAIIDYNRGKGSVQ